MLCMKCIPSNVWGSLTKHIQSCMYPRQWRAAITSLQRHLLHCSRRRMASLLQLLEDQDAGHWSLAPTNTVVHNTALAFETLRHGDHVVVMIGGWRHRYAHHGIVSRHHANDTPSIANFSSPTGDSKMRDAKLQFVRYDVFLAGHHAFGCVTYSGEEGEERDDAMQRERAVKIVSLLIQLPQASLHEYHLLRWNCECFAWMCKTGGMHTSSDQVARILHSIRTDLRKGNESFMLQAGIKVLYSV